MLKELLQSIDLKGAYDGGSIMVGISLQSRRFRLVSDRIIFMSSANLDQNLPLRRPFAVAAATYATTASAHEGPKTWSPNTRLVQSLEDRLNFQEIQKDISSKQKWRAKR